jgi:single-strand DNA-binding protein
MYHTLIIVGNVGRDPEMRYTPTGSPVTSFPVATNRQYNHDGETVKETIWFRVTVWGKQAETCNEYVAKGMKVLVEGRLTPDSAGNPRIWADKDGNSHANFEVTAGTVRFLSKGKEKREEDDFGDTDINQDAVKEAYDEAEELRESIKKQAEEAIDGIEKPAPKTRKPAAKKKS